MREEVFNLSANSGEPEKLEGEPVTQNLFSLLGVKPILGRVFTREEDRPGAAHVALISYRLWKSWFTSDPNVAGRDILLNSRNTR